MAKLTDKELITRVKGRAEGAEKIRKGLEIAWKRNLFYFHNRLNYKYIAKEKAFKVVWQAREYIPVNLMVKIYQSRLAKLMVLPTTCSADPRSIQASDIASARYAEKLARAVVQPLIDLKKEECFFWSTWVNRPLWKIRWDETLGDYIHKPIYTNQQKNYLGEFNAIVPSIDEKGEIRKGEDGNPIQALYNGLPQFQEVYKGEKRFEDFREGDLRFSVISPFEYTIDPLARGDDVLDPKTENKARWIRQNKIVDKQYLIAKYGKEKVGDITFTKRVAISGVEEEIWRLKNLPVEVESTQTVELFEYWELPSDDFPNGLILTYIDNNIILQKEETLPKPWQSLGRLPYLDTPAEIHIPYRYYGETLMEKVAPLQRDYSQWASHMSELRSKTGEKDAFLPGGSNFRRIESGDTQLNNIYRFDGVQQPAIVEYDTFPATMIKDGDRLLMNIEMVSGSSEMKYPFKQKTATEILQTIEQDETRISTFKNKILRLYAELTKLGLEEIRVHYDPTRKINVTGDYGIIETIEFEKTKLSGNYDIYIQASPMPLGSLLGQVSLVKDFINMGILNPIQNDSHKQIIMNMLNMRTGIQSTEEQLNEKVALRENLMCRQGEEIPPPTEHQNHTIHLLSHRNWINAEEPVVGSLEYVRMDKHIKETQALYDQQLLKIMQMQQMAQGGGVSQTKPTPQGE